MDENDTRYSADQVRRLIEALRLTTSSLRRSGLPGCEARYLDSEALLREFGIEPIANVLDTWPLRRKA